MRVKYWALRTYIFFLNGSSFREDLAFYPLESVEYGYYLEV
jgi:hypothetical protein